MIAESRRHASEQILSQIPELGPVRVAQIIATVDTPHRFRTKRLCWKYLGLAVEMRSSADHEIVDGRVRRRKNQVVQTRGLRGGLQPATQSSLQECGDAFVRMRSVQRILRGALAEGDAAGDGAPERGKKISRIGVSGVEERREL